MLLEESLSYRVRGCVFDVFRELGAGFLEKVYERALLKEFELQGVMAEGQVPLAVSYKNSPVGQYVADIIVENRIILELKARPGLSPSYEAQLLNYLRASNLRVGMLINFVHPKATIKRIVI